MRARHARIFCAAFLFLALLNCSSKTAHFHEALNIAVPYEPDTLDPHAKSTISAYCLTANFYEPLVSSDASMKLRPCLAKFWENPDPNTWLFHLQPGVHFHSGRSLSSEDVVFSIDRLIRDKNLDVSALLTDVSSVKAIDPMTVELHTEVPISILLNKISFAMIVPKGSTAEMLAQHENGTGPYKLQAWQKGRSLRMTRNEEYWRPKAEIADVTYSFSRSSEQALQDFSTGNFGIVLCNSKKLKDAIQNHAQFEMQVHDSLSVKYLAWDLSRDQTPDCTVTPNPFKNPLVRKAIQLGIDQQEVISSLPAYAAPTTQVVPPFVFGFNSAIRQVASDRTKARELLKQAGLANGFPVTLTARQILQETAENVRVQLSKIGILADLRILPDSNFFDVLNRREASFYLSKLSTTTGDASDVLEAAFHSPDGTGFGIYNWGDYRNASVDHAIEQSMQVLTVEERRSSLQTVISSVMDDLAWLPLYVDQEVYAVDKTLSWQPRNDGLVLAYEIKRRRE